MKDITKEDKKALDNYIGYDTKHETPKRRKMLLTIYHYQQGWINSIELEQKLTEILYF